MHRPFYLSAQLEFLRKYVGHAPSKGNFGFVAEGLEDEDDQGGPEPLPDLENVLEPAPQQTASQRLAEPVPQKTASQRLAEPAPQQTASQRLAEPATLGQRASHVTLSRKRSLGWEEDAAAFLKAKMERREKKSNVLAFFEGLAPQVERLSPQGQTHVMARVSHLVFQTLIEEQQGAVEVLNTGEETFV